MRKRKLPFTYYINHVDEYLLKGIEHIHSAFGKHRAEWQILYAVYNKGRVHVNELKTFMQPYADACTVNNILTKLKIQCIIFHVEDKITLTSNGVDYYRNCFNSQQYLP